MNDRCMKVFNTLCVLVFLAGCQKSVKQEVSSLAVDPMAEKVVVPPQFASAAIDKAGGLEAWGRVREIQLDCVVTFYDKDAGYYLTGQKYDIFPWSNSIVISGKEKNSDYEWQLSQGKFEVLKGPEKIENFKNQIDNSCFAESILNLVTAPARFLDKSAKYSRDANSVNIQGRWCYPITRTKAADSKSVVLANKNIFYQNKETSLVDMLLLSCKSNNSYYLVCGYDYTPIEEGEISVPNRIEIYTSSSDAIAQRQIFRIDISASSQK